MTPTNYPRLSLVAAIVAGVSVSLVTTVPAHAAGEPCSLASMTFRMTSGSPGPCGIEFHVDHSLAGGGFLGSLIGGPLSSQNGDLRCEYLGTDPNAYAYGNNNEGSQTLELMSFSESPPPVSPADLWRCMFVTSGVLPATSDFSIDASVGVLDGGGEFCSGSAPATVEISDLSCGGFCLSKLQSGCSRPDGASSLLIKNDPDHDTKDQVTWKWKKGPAIDLTDVSNPTTTGHYSLCFYDFADFSLRAEVNLPPGTGWEPTGTTGYLYKDKNAAVGGVTSVKLKSGTVGKTSVGVKAKGLNLPDTLLPAGGGGYVVWLVDQHNPQDCWQSIYSPNGVVISDSFRFKATESE